MSAVAVEDVAPQQPASGGAAEFLPQTALMSFAPINQIHQHLVGLHCYSVDRTRAVPSHHFCSCAPKQGVRQCIIYDSDGPNARLIGIEYVINAELFHGLAEDEKKFWHSHKFEVESGMLQLGTKSLVPTAAEDLAEQAAMKELHQTYGKTIHTWDVDSSPILPLGPPSLMKSFTPSDPLSTALKTQYETIRGVPDILEHKKGVRAEYLDTSFEPDEAADYESRTGKGVSFEPKEVDVKNGTASWKGVGSLVEYHEQTRR